MSEENKAEETNETLSQKPQEHREPSEGASVKTKPGNPRQKANKPKGHGAHSKHATSEDTTSRKELRRGPVMGAIAAVVVAILCVGIFALPQSQTPIELEKLVVQDITDIPSTDQEQKDNPIDFAALQAQNPDIYAWLYVPGTKVSLPILQSSMADNYYLYHNLEGEDDPVGAIYTQARNSKDFTDPVTVIYGHTFQPDDDRADEAFGTLHSYEDKAFFDEHPYFYIYTPTKMFTYQVVSAYEYDNSHILNTNDFSDPEVLQRYLDLVVNPEDADANVGGIQKLEAGKAYIVQLSTCARPSVSENRYILTGVMVGEHSYETITSITKG